MSKQGGIEVALEPPSMRAPARMMAAVKNTLDCPLSVFLLKALILDCAASF